MSNSSPIADRLPGDSLAPSPSLRPSRPPPIPLWLKLAGAVFLCIIIPVNTHYYGALKFLWFSQIGLFGTVLALWLESRLLTSMMLLLVFLADGVAWTADFLCGLLASWYPLGMADYMFDPQWPLFVRSLSLFHMVVPVVLVWLIWRRGYDSRAMLAQTILGCILLGVTYKMTRRSDNINRVYGPFQHRQKILPPLLYLVLLMAGSPILLYLPVHLAILLYRRLRGTAPTGAPRMVAAAPGNLDVERTGTDALTEGAPIS